MFDKKTFNWIYPKENYAKYVWRKIYHAAKKYAWDWIPASIMCIRYPFLYPKNAFTGKFYRAWGASQAADRHYRKYFWETIREEGRGAGGFIDREVNIRPDDYYIEKYGEACVSYRGERFLTLNYDYIFKKEASLWDKIAYYFFKGWEKFAETVVCIPTYTRYDAIPYGWRKRFGKDLCRELKEALKKDGMLYKYQITQIKEKYGRLEIYDYGAGKHTRRVIDKYEYISQFVCIGCGEDADYLTMGWICPYCEKCLPKNEKFHKWIQPIYGYTNSQKEKENEQIQAEIDEAIAKSIAKIDAKKAQEAAEK